MQFNENLARQVVQRYTDDTEAESGLSDAFVEVCRFLSDNPDSLSWRSRSKPSLYTEEGLSTLAQKHFDGYRRSDFPAEPGTVPDEIVSVVLNVAYEYSAEDCERMKREHQHSMCAENCVGALLERYLDSALRPNGWHWCCGNFVKAIDFVRKDEQGKWLALQIKNRDNSENSSSSAIRKDTEIQKWFRSFSKKGGTNWDNLPSLMQGYGLSEEGFRQFVTAYLQQEKRIRNESTEI